MPEFNDIVTVLYRLRTLGRRKSVPTLREIVAGQRVQIEGAGDVCVVLHVDRKRHVAELLRLGPVRTVESGIPLVLLTPVEQEPEAAGEMQISA